MQEKNTIDPQEPVANNEGKQIVEIVQHELITIAQEPMVCNLEGYASKIEHGIVTQEPMTSNLNKNVVETTESKLTTLT